MSTEKNEKVSALDAMLAQYNSSTAPKNGKFETGKVYELKNYFNTFIKEGLKSATKEIRILPTADGSSPFVEMHGHKVQVDGQWKTFACLKHELNEPCPFCEAKDALYATGKDADKELAKKYNARKMYVVKVIDRANEEEGVKFWRFNHDFRKEGILDKIFGVLQAVKKDVTHPETGRDLMLTINRNPTTKAITVSSVSHMDPSPLSTDPALVAAWTTDARTWKDVYAVKSYDFLEIIVRGGVPVWDKEAKKFVDKDSLKGESDNLEQELTLGVENVKKNVTAATEVTSDATSEVATEGDDLPF